MPFFITKKKTHQHKIDVEKLTVGKILKNMKPAQLWTVLGLLCSLISSSFFLGEYLTDVNSEINCNSKILQIETIQKEETLKLKGELEKFKIDIYQLQKRAQFLSDYVDLLLLREAYQKDPKLKREYYKAEKKFRTYFK